MERKLSRNISETEASSTQLTPGQKPPCHSASRSDGTETAERHSGFRIGARRSLCHGSPHHSHSSVRPRLALERVGWSTFWSLALDPRTLKRAQDLVRNGLPGGAANVVFGVLLACVLVRYTLSRRARHRCDGRPAIRASDRGRRHRADDALCANGWIGSIWSRSASRLPIRRPASSSPDLRRPAFVWSARCSR